MGSRLRDTGAIWSAADKASSVLALIARIRELERTALFPVEGWRNSFDPERDACSGGGSSEDFFLLLIELL